ncbi:MAG TPA: YebC/PmpR family DNA-binding transcriptional regulator [Chloroflexota bacterium]|nr:YebC/PmpR family DNA-binding transcriptional regulator [Chloroflexota bacterium]
MSGHSKWSQIKRQKSAADAKRGQMFTKLGREITVAVREGGPDPDANPRLRQAIQRARDASMPAETIERAIKRAMGTSEGAALEEVIYEGYGPGGAAILVQALTDNRNRAVAEIRSVFTRAGGSLGESGCVAWLFEPRGVIVVEGSGRDPDELGLLAIDAGAEDVRVEDGIIEVLTQPGDLEAVRAALEAHGVKVTSAETAMVPKTTIPLDERNAVATLRLMERLEELDDVQRVYTNLEISDAALRAYEGR